MNKSQKSIYTAVSAIILTLINGLLGLIVTKLIISNYGSDFNGINSTANQFINMLLIIEGGFTLATNVALFKPLSNYDYSSINRIMSATKIIFIKIGIIFLSIGIVASVVYSMVINSELSRETATLTFLMTVISTSFNLIYSTKYRILLQAEQREYILNFIKIGTIITSQCLIISIIFLNSHMLLVRFITMVGDIINSLLIGYACKKNYKYLNFNVEPNYIAIRGTKDVFIQKITSMVYSSVPIIFISATVGTMYASVYAVYNSIFLLLKSIIYSFINAPRIGFGKLIAEKDKEYVYKVFIQYEFIVNNVMLCFLITTAVLFMPFINIYTKGIGDINYKNWGLAIILIFITLFEIIHIPSGNIINMSGNFEISKKIQTIASLFIVIGMIAGNFFYGFYGILISVLITSLLLAILEILYTHKVYFKKSVSDFLILLVPQTILSIVLVYFEIMNLPTIDSYMEFILVGFIVMIINSGILLIINFILNKRLLFEVFRKLRIT